MSGGFRVSDSTVETAARAACVEADWTWTADFPSVPGPVESMTPIVAAALAAVLPSLVAEIEQRAREQIVAEIEATAMHWTPWCSAQYIRGVRAGGFVAEFGPPTAVAADRVARGDAG